MRYIWSFPLPFSVGLLRRMNVGNQIRFTQDSARRRERAVPSLLENKRATEMINKLSQAGMTVKEEDSSTPLRMTIKNKNYSLFINHYSL